MPRSGEAARQRLQAAALDLYGEHGFDSVTAAEIAARAGVTERTYFRHFADKREVLFDGEEPLRDALSTAVQRAPRDLPPLPTLLSALLAAAVPRLEANRALTVARHQVISASPALRERDLAKGESLTSALAAALEQRGVGERTARLAAEVGMVTWGQAVNVWLIEPLIPLETHLTNEFDALAELTRHISTERDSTEELSTRS
ncbi:helix-turn-helix domain-containing protein [Gordonia sp. DT218]|uniref:TetR/AcrR family transcriptional regulator n=1 Tax=unclassified Gordonia (in: high G+C Gram-positive bacteria) TaxID=2657482 RepID=UPI003CE87B5A